MDRVLRPSRRAFLKGVAASVAGALSLPALAAEAGSGPLRIGFIVPASRLRPRLAQQLVAGFRLHPGGSVLGGRPVQLLQEPVGVTPGQALAAARRLVEQQGAELLVGPLAPAAVQALRPLLEQHRIPLLVAATGANTVRPEETGPMVLYHTLEHWRATWALGHWTARTLGPRVAVATSIYDSGYDHLYTFAAGVAAGGGELVGTLFSDALPGEHELPRLLAELGALAPSAAFLLHSDPIAERLAGDLAMRGIPVVASDPAGLGHATAPAAVALAGSWSTRLALPQARAFTADYHAGYGERPSGFAVLGYECALLLDALLAGGRTRLRSFDDLADLDLTGPRGPLRLDLATRTLRAPLYLLTATGEGVEELAEAPSAAAALAALHAGPRSGWLSDYLFL